MVPPAVNSSTGCSGGPTGSPAVHRVLAAPNSVECPYVSYKMSGSDVCSGAAEKNILVLIRMTIASNETSLFFTGENTITESTDTPKLDNAVIRQGNSNFFRID